MNCLAVFRSRSDAMKVYNALKAKKIACSAVNTPSYLKLGCGVSVVFPSQYSEEVAAIVRERGIGSFAGIYKR